MIIAINGRIGSGKDTVGKIIQYLMCKQQTDYKGYLVNPTLTYEEFLDPKRVFYYDWEIKKFAGKLKQIVSILTGCDINDLENQEFKNQYLHSDWGYYKNEIPLRPMALTPEAIKDLDDKRLHLYTYRELLQKIGTDALRNVIHENIWVNALMNDYKIKYINQARGKETLIGNYEYYKSGLDSRAEIVTKKEPDWIITDMRFPNEFKAVKDKNGICIRVTHYQDIINQHSGKKDDFTIEKFNINNKNHLKFYKAKCLSEHESETALDNHTFDYEIDNDGSIEDLIEQVKLILIKEIII